MKMQLTLYNTLSRKKEPFVPLDSKLVRIYTCGPTVYNYMHIGNLRSFLFEDVLKRTVMFNGFKVKHVLNITDVGHLTSDADEGEDKMLKGAKREGKTVWEVADFYTKAFQNDYLALNLIKPFIWCKATDHIKEQIEMIKKLEKKGFTYIAEGNVYFDTSKIKDYGKLAKLDLKAETKARVEKDQNKKNSHDFVLWFTKSKFQDQEMKWDSPWGTGYPGWHIECSAMATKYLGEQFDIHCGGIDHIPVHHPNEIAQSEAALGVKPWAKYWLHNEFLVLASGDKMAKSGENFLTLTVLREKGIEPLDYRYFCLGTHYRVPLMFSYEGLEGAKNTRRRVNNFIKTIKILSKVQKNTSPLSEIIKELILRLRVQFTQEINDDLNIPRALATLHELLSEVNKRINSVGINKEDAKNIIKFMGEIDAVLGFMEFEEKKEEIPGVVQVLARQRLIARQNKEWKKSDELRDKIKELGWIVGDTKDGYELKKG